MDFTFIQELIIPIILVACLVVGYCIKHIKALHIDELIPSIMAALGISLSLLCIRPVTMESIIAGAVTGLASTGLHQAFKQLIERGKEE